MIQDSIPLFEPYIGYEEKKAIDCVLESKQLSRGPWVEQFEYEFAAYVGKKYAIAVNSGTSGLHLCVKAAGWQENDEVITTPYSFIASTNCLLYENITPIFCDVDPITFNIPYSNIIPKITAKTRGVLIVDILGLSAVSKDISTFCKGHKFCLLEDACEAVGKTSTKFPVSKFSDMAVYGFCPNKQMTTGEGGMVVTDDANLAQYIRSLRNQGYSTASNWLDHVIMGYNYRMSDIQAALGIAQLKKLDFILEQRSEIAAKYNKLLENIPGITLLKKQNLKRSYFNYTILIEEPQKRQNIMNKLKEQRIGFNSGFVPLHYFPHIKKLGYQKGDFPVTEKIAEQTLSLPFFVNITNQQIKTVCNLIKKEML